MSWDACYEAATPPEAHVVKGFLEHRGVPCLLRGEGTVYPSAAFGLRVHVLVPSHWLPVARQLVASRAGRRRRGGRARVVTLAGRTPR
jgi:hypothetical protein